MKQVNKQRATLICNEYANGECTIDVKEVIQRFLKNTPSIIEQSKCKSKGCASKTADFLVSVLTLDKTAFNNNLSNLEKAIIADFPKEPICRKCRQRYQFFVRIPGSQLFIEVR